LNGLAANNGIPTARDAAGLPNYAPLQVALGVGEVPASSTQNEDQFAYWQTGDRQFGPSSDHDAVTIHTFGDNHTTALTVDIDANVYAAIVTINGGENVNLDDL